MPRKRIWLSTLLCCVLAGAVLLVMNISGSPVQKAPVIWDLNKLYQPPVMKWVIREGAVYALEYHGMPYRGGPTSVFAYYVTPGIISGNPGTDKKLPAVILLHGGRGHADYTWATHWAQMGYAALAIDLSGSGRDLAPLPNAVSNDNYLDVDLNTHMVSNVILAHSLLLSFNEVDKKHTAVIGVSVGGQLACIVAGLDERFTAAATVYGCGFLQEDSLFTEMFSKMDREKQEDWVARFDPSGYLKDVTIPMLFVTGAEDPFYSLGIFAKSYRLTKGHRNYCILPGIPHNATTGMAIRDVPLFINQFCKDGVPIPTICTPEIVQGRVRATFRGKTKSVKAGLFYTLDDCAYKERIWKSSVAAIEGTAITCQAPPEGATAWLLSLADDHGAVVSSEVMFRDGKEALSDEKRE